MKRIILALAVCMGGFINAGSLTELQKVFFHRIAHKDQSSLELAKISFYFTQEPMVRMLHTATRDARTIVTLFVPGATLAASLKLPPLHHDLFEVQCKAVQSPSAGIEFTISYDTAQVLFMYDFFDTITLQKGIVFTFLNKQLLQGMKEKVKKNTILRTAQAKPTVIIDAGHGGSDTGTVNPQQVKEKDITLMVARELQNVLVQKGFEVCMLRAEDVFIPLDERTSRANRTPLNKNSIFISLHANYAPKEDVSGLEVYCLKDALFKKGSGLETSIDVLVHDYQSMRYTQSYQLAQQVHDALLQHMHTVDAGVKDRSIKYAVSQVMMGVHMPAILIEMGFLSNEKEARLLTKPAYQRAIAYGISDGISKYQIKRT